jgi:hypothetical protein
MKSIIKSIKQTEFTTIITTKSNKVKVFTFSTIEENNEFFNFFILKMSLCKLQM